MVMRKKIVIPVVMAVALIGSLSVATLLEHQSSSDVNKIQCLKSNDKDVTKEDKEEKLKELKKQKKEIEQTRSNSKSDLDKEKKLSEQISEQEQELGIEDSKEIFETSLNTLNVVVTDTQRELDRKGVPEKLEAKAKERVKKLGKIAEKYEKKSNSKTLSEDNYKKLFKEMNGEVNNAVMLLDQEFPTK